MKKVAVSLAFFAALMGCLFLSDADAKHSQRSDKEFLRQCQVSQSDIDIIPLLSNQTQAEISGWIKENDCQKLAPFKISREYYRQLKHTGKLTLPPPEWDTAYLTDEEFLDFAYTVNGSPLYGGGPR